MKILETYPAKEGLWLVEVKVSPSNRISVFADRREGITIDECVSLSRFIEHRLDREREDFELIVSSPGLDMPFLIREQYEKNLGNRVKVKLTGHKELKGTLVALTEKGIVLEEDEKKKKKKKKDAGEEGPRRHNLSFEEIEQTKLIIEF